MHVLCVDDEPTNRRIIREILLAADIDVTDVEDAETGLALLDTSAFDLVLMDLRMPGMDGLTAVRHIRGRPDGAAATPVILVTADTSADLDDRSRAAGANLVVRKPVDMRVLFDAIAGVMDGGGGAEIALS
jgi:CheY-like chemotaxis protein